MQKKVSKNILAIPCSVQKIYIIYYVIHNFRQEGHATKIKKGGGERNKVNCVLLNPCTQKKERKLKHAETSRYKILTIPRECTKI